LRDRSDRQLVFNRRALILTGLGAIGFMTTSARLAWLQLVNTEDYRSMSASNQFNFRLIVPPRGAVLDRYGDVVAGVRLDYRVILDPEATANVDATLDALGQLVTLTPARRRAIKRDVASKPKSTPILALEGLSWEAFSRIAVRAPNLPGVRAEAGELRAYPKGPAFAHVVGYVGKPSEKDQMLDPSQILREPGFRIGKSGVEKAYEMQLRGQPGARKVEVDAYGRTVREWADGRTPVVAGAPLRLTIDAHVQDYAAWRLKDESASAVMMDVITGDIMAMVSTPAFDPNSFVSGIPAEEYALLRDDMRTPLRNKPFAGLYPPGSTFKAVTALAALEAGVMPPDQRVVCNGKTRLGNHTFHCWKREGHGAVDLHEAIKGSCDIYFYEAARRTGPDIIAKVARSFGLGEIHDLKIEGQKSGIVPDTAWKQKRYHQAWLVGESYNYGIGQGYLLTNPLQLAVMTARLATGRMVEPRLVMDPHQPRFSALPIHPDHVDRVRAAMTAVSNDERGTAYRASQMDLGSVRMAGKTGTAQVRRISAAERLRGVIKNENLEWKMRDHALFVAFAPVDAPRYAISVVIEHGGSGSRAAAPPARDIMREALLRDTVVRDRLLAEARAALAPAPSEPEAL